jgi:hypothetical protein
MDMKTKKCKRPYARKLLTTLVLAILGMPMGTAMAQNTTLPGFGELPFAAVAPRVRVVVDPDLETPALVDFDAAGGFPTSAPDAEGRGRAAFFHPLVTKMYGTLNPLDHLQFTWARKDHSGNERINFEQRDNGIRVEGAYVSVTVSPAKRVRQIHSRFLYFPQIDWDTVLKSSDLEAVAGKAYLANICTEKGDCIVSAYGDRTAKSVPAELVIVSSRLLQGTTLPPQTDRLAWRFEYPLAQVYVDASGKGGALLVTSKQYDALPHDVYDFPSKKIEFSTDPMRTTPSPSAEALMAHDMVDKVDAFYAGLGRNGFDDAGRLIEVWIRWNVVNASFAFKDASLIAHPWLPNAFFPAGMVIVGETLLGGDIVAHEITHGVTRTTSNLMYAGESGALNESYSDVMGNLVFPDRIAMAWLHGEESIHGASRDMANPSNPSVASAHWQPDHVMTMPYACLADLDKCVHTWSGVPNLAAVLIAQGGQVPSSGGQVAWPGIGPEKLAVLYFETLTGTRLGPSSNFLSQRLATLSECQDLIASGYTANGSKPFTANDCKIVEQAFDAVGIVENPQYGWTRFPAGLGSIRVDIPVFSGERLFNGCTITDQRLTLWDGQHAARSANITDGLTLDMGGWGGSVRVRGAATDPTDRSATVHLWADWVVPSPNSSFTDTFYLAPGMLTKDDCLHPLPPPGTPAPARRTFYSTQRVSHWATFFDGGRNDDTVNGGIQLPAGCAVTNVRGILMDRTSPASSPLPNIDLLTRGFRVTWDPGNNGILDAMVHTWHDGLSSIAVRVAYDIDESQGADCLVPGALQATSY